MQGELRLQDIRQWLTQADALAGSGQIDLAGITRIDSAGAAFLLELTRRARASGHELQFANPNEQVRGLLQFLQIDGVLNIAG